MASAILLAAVRNHTAAKATTGATVAIALLTAAEISSSVSSQQCNHYWCFFHILTSQLYASLPRSVLGDDKARTQICADLTEEAIKDEFFVGSVSQSEDFSGSSGR